MEYDRFRVSEREGWGERAGFYDEATARATTQVIPALLDAVRIHHGVRLLDAGCGPGYAAAAAAALGARVKGVDFSPEMVAAARQRFPGLSFELADIETLDETDGSYDAVVSNIALFHVTDPARALAEAHRVLAPGGRFGFSQWCAPAQSPLYRELLGIVTAHADLSRAEPAPDAFALSNADHVRDLMQQAGFRDVESRELDTVLRAPGADFYSFFLRFGVRVPLILSHQTAPVQTAIRQEVNSHFRQYLRGDEIHVGMPSVVYWGTRPD